MVFLLVVAGAIVVWRSTRDIGTSSPMPPPARETTLVAESTAVQKEGEPEVRRLEREMAALRRELEERSVQIRELKGRLEQTSSALASAQAKLAEARREKERLAALAAQTGAGELAAPVEPPRSREAPVPREVPLRKEVPPGKEAGRPGIWSRPAEPGTYETIRAASVFEEPSRSARTVASIRQGTKVSVVGSRGEWLEIRSKHGNPPGFIHREDAMFLPGSD